MNNVENNNVKIYWRIYLNILEINNLLLLLSKYFIFLLEEYSNSPISEGKASMIRRLQISPVFDNMDLNQTNDLSSIEVKSKITVNNPGAIMLSMVLNYQSHWINYL